MDAVVELTAAGRGFLILREKQAEVSADEFPYFDVLGSVQLDRDA